MSRAPLGVIGGSGLYQMAGLADVREERVRTPFGDPSDAYLVGRIDGRPLIFLARHGRGHRLLPGEINFRANLYGFKTLGVERLVSVSAVGSMKESLAPLDVVLPDQFIDWTRHRPSTFFGDGLVAHVSLADPVCNELRAEVARAAAGIKVRLHDGGTYLCIEGPQFSTRAESRLYRTFGVDVIGMTNVQEAKLAREAEICYATMAMVTDYDCWHEEEAAVTVAEVVARLNENAAHAQAIVKALLAALPEARSCGCAGALDNAVLTEPGRIPAPVLERLRPILGRRFS
ncbi:MAG TPA: S-methyl-5'-thioadenosine phosphorylase [Patescibacteria group bacterium]|nr:S-methyl-5'-thioadenosine phosphorylase [Patescibacteria group bacterium]